MCLHRGEGSFEPYSYLINQINRINAVQTIYGKLGKHDDVLGIKFPGIFLFR